MLDFDSHLIIIAEKLTAGFFGGFAVQLLLSPGKSRLFKYGVSAIQEVSLFKRVAGSTLFIIGIVANSSSASAYAMVSTAKPLPAANTNPASERGMWSWQDSDIGTRAKQIKLLDFSVNKKITTVYIHAEGLLKNNPQLLASFIDLAATRNIRVELLFGAPEWTFTGNHQIALTLVTKANAFVNSLRGARPVGLHFDVEPHALPGWEANQASYGSQLLDLYAKIRQAKRPDLYLNADIAMGYGVVKLTRNGVTKPLTHWLVDMTDRTTLMAYRDYAQGPDSIIAHGNVPVNYAATVGKRAHIAVETTCNLDPEKITFCEEGNAEMQAGLDSVVANYRTGTGFGGVAIHDYRAYLMLR